MASFHKLTNEKGYRDIELGELACSKSYQDFDYCKQFRVDEVRRAISKMKRGREIKPNEISIDLLKNMVKDGIKWLHRLFNIIMKTAKIHDERKKNLHIVFIDLDKAYEKVPRDVL